MNSTRGILHSVPVRIIPFPRSAYHRYTLSTVRLDDGDHTKEPSSEGTPTSRTSAHANIMRDTIWGSSPVTGEKMMLMYGSTVPPMAFLAYMPRHRSRYASRSS